MGTRHLIAVVKDGNYKVAKYGQWDGYPSGQGIDILEFLKDNNKVIHLKDNLSKVRFIDEDGVDKEFIESYNKNAPKWSRDPDNRTEEQIYWFETYMSRSLGSKILSNIAESKDDEILLRNSIDFAKNSLFCEWAYVIDFDSNEFEVYEGFNKQAVEEGRFASNENNEYGYYPVRLIARYSMDDLPEQDEFLLDTENQDD